MCEIIGQFRIIVNVCCITRKTISIQVISGHIINLFLFFLLIYIDASLQSLQPGVPCILFSINVVIRNLYLELSNPKHLHIFY